MEKEQKVWWILVSCVLLPGILGLSQAWAQNLPGFRVTGRHLYDHAGEKVIPIGVNEMFIWAAGNEDGARIHPEIAKTGANCVRIVWQTNGAVATLDRNIQNCINHKMIPMPEIHNATGNIDQVGQVVDWWVRSDVVTMLRKHEKYLLINIANEAGNHNVTNAKFLQVYKDAIQRMRAAGYKVPLIIDAPGWGQNIGVLHATWKELMDSDPLKNLMFSVHMWWVAGDGSKSKIINELKKSVDIGMPTIVGEFAPMGVNCARRIDYITIMDECRRHGIGHLAWSWGWVGNGDCSEMGMTTNGIFGNWRNVPDFGKWGEVVAITDPNSIKNTAVIPKSISGTTSTVSLSVGRNLVRASRPAFRGRSIVWSGLGEGVWSMEVHDVQGRIIARSSGAGANASLILDQTRSKTVMVTIEQDGFKTSWRLNVAL